MAVTAQERLASAMGSVMTPAVLPYLPSPVEIGHLAHVQGYYAGVIIATPPVVATGAPTAVFRPIWRSGARRR